MAGNPFQPAINIIDPKIDDFEDVDPIVDPEADEADYVPEAESDPNAPIYDDSTGNMEIPLPDGSVVIQLDAPRPQSKEDSDHYDNLAETLDESTLGRIAEDLMTGIDADDQSRASWLEMRKKGLDLLGLKVEPTRSAPDSGGVMEGMATVRHPLLQEAVLRFQANAFAELCPPAGPARVVNYGDQVAEEDTLAAALEQDFNYYLTSIATEYYDDTNNMLWQVGFSGMAAKKVYNCPLRRRPVSETVDAQHLIVSNAATTLRDAGRVTHQIQMRRSVLKRMQLLGVYRNIDLTEPTYDPNPVDAKEAKIQGFDIDKKRPEDQDYNLYECYCELDIEGFEHRDEDGNETGLPLPYRVTMDRDSRRILEIRRNWLEDDEDHNPTIPFVIYRYVNAMGFYGVGLLQILGNTTAAITMAWRLMLDAGMFASFPGFLFLEGAGRQTTNEFRIPPGGGKGVKSDVTDIRQAIMPLPYKEAGPGLMKLIEDIANTGQRVGGTAEVNVGDGAQNAPVGTTMALIDQATKVEAAVHRGLHTAQDNEFRLLKNLFREDPEALWRGNARCELKRDVQRTLTALEDCDLVPRSDPNVPSRMHRLAKIAVVKQLQAANPQLYDPKAVDTWALPQLGVDDPESLFIESMPDEGPSIDDQVKMGKLQLDNQKLQLEHAKMVAKVKDDQANRQSKENLAILDLAETVAAHPEGMDEAQQFLLSDQTDVSVLGQQTQQEAQQTAQQAVYGMAEGGQVHNVQLNPYGPDQEPEMVPDIDDATRQKLEYIAMMLERSLRPRMAELAPEQGPDAPVYNEMTGAYDVGVV